MSNNKVLSIKEYTKEKLTSGGSYLFLMLFQEHCKKGDSLEKRTAKEWDKLLDEFGTQPTKDVFEKYDPFD